jgi:26S proteasome regulatory subunit N12
MEGSYSKVWSARNEAPAEEYKFFVDSLMGTIRYVREAIGNTLRIPMIFQE